MAVFVIGGYVPVNGDIITFIDAASVSGDFDEFDRSFPPGWSVLNNYPNTGEVSLLFGSLPVEMTGFRAELTAGKDIMLSWARASEINNKGFQIEHSTDGKDWSDLGFVAGTGNTLEVQYYSFHHLHPVSGHHYYRLRQIDLDGNHSYFPVVTVSVPGESSVLSLFPNPATRTAYLSIGDPFSEGCLEVFDPAGKRLLFEKIAPDIDLLSFSISDFSPGIYYLKILLDGEVITKKMHVGQ